MHIKLICDSVMPSGVSVVGWMSLCASLGQLNEWMKKSAENANPVSLHANHFINVRTQVKLSLRSHNM